MVAAVNPWWSAFRREACFPLTVLSPVLLNALRRFASICLGDVMRGAVRSRPASLARVSEFGAQLEAFHSVMAATDLFWWPAVMSATAL
jgi:hypothetical protein